MAIGYNKTTWTDGVTDVNATNMNHIEDGIKAACDGVDALNNNLTWKSIPAVQGKVNSALPTDYSEIEISIYNANDNESMVIRLCKNELPLTPRGFYLTGYYVSSENYGCAYYYISQSSVLVGEVKMKGTDVSNIIYTTVYYR